MWQAVRQRQRQWRIHLVLHFWPDISQQRLPTTWVRVVFSRLVLALVELCDPGEVPETAPCWVAVGATLPL